MDYHTALQAPQINFRIQAQASYVAGFPVPLPLPRGVDVTVLPRARPVVASMSRALARFCFKTTPALSIV